jgi:3-deoxy-D-manno-oct-2-ulosonic acid (Kdo) hydroxylase
MARITIAPYRPGSPATDEQFRRLEAGDILYFPTTPFSITHEERSFLLEQKQSDASYHKNISYRPKSDRLKGVDQKVEASLLRMHRVMRDYSERAITFTASFLSRYSQRWRIDFASFRPIEEEGRDVAQRSRNDLIHIDSFPTRPSSGDRILRIFTNIHPSAPRVWITSDPFEDLATQYAHQAGLSRPRGSLARWRHNSLSMLSRVGLPIAPRPEYDEFMLRFHHFLKESTEFQQHCRKERWEFPPGATWIVFTDTTSHSCISGQYALEQTFFVSRDSLAWPEKAPIAILERMTGRSLAPPRAKSA